jgi:hypothetical protein
LPCCSRTKPADRHSDQQMDDQQPRFQHIHRCTPHRAT